MSASDDNRIKVHVVPTLTHGRVLVREARAVAQKGLLVGFHGYKENAGAQMERLEAVPGIIRVDARVDTRIASVLSRTHRGSSGELDDARRPRGSDCR